MSFQKTVLIVAVVAFLIMMIFIAVMMNSAKKEEIFPPQTGSCPDYWRLLPGTGECQNVQLLGNSCKQTKNFSAMDQRAKCNFAKDCKITWDGITNAQDKNGFAKYCKV
jgi:CPW-WPC domain-containing protein